MRTFNEQNINSEGHTTDLLTYKERSNSSEWLERLISNDLQRERKSFTKMSLKDRDILKSHKILYKKQLRENPGIHEVERGNIVELLVKYKSDPKFNVRFVV